MVKVLVAFLLTGLLCPCLTAKAQNLISESGRIIFFNSLDSARGAALSRLASLAACWLYYNDPQDSFPVLLDLRPDTTISRDSIFPELGYDNLFGNSLSYTDSSADPTDPSLQRYYNRLGLRIRLRTAESPADSNADPRTLLRLLEYGVAHYKTLTQTRTLCLADSPLLNPGSDPGPLTLVPQDIAHILSRPISPKVLTALKKCE